MKRKSILSAGSILVALMAAQLYAVELKNSSFETSEDEANPISDKASDWGRWGHWINRETGWSPTRTGNCLMGYHHFRIEQSDDSGLYQDVAEVPDGGTCLFTVYAMRDEGTNIESVELRLENLNGGGKLGSTKYKVSDLKVGQWTPLSVKGVTSKQGVRVLIVIKPDEKGPRKGAVKLDDAQLEVMN